MQQGLCAICGQPEKAFDARTGEKRGLALDHDHATGKHRELLCTACNAGIGQFGESVERLLAAIEYLRKHQLTTVR